MSNGIVSVLYKTKEIKTAKNAEIAASATEQTITGTTLVDHYNSLLVQNLDTSSDVEIRLDAFTEKRFFVQKGGGVVNIEPQDNINFRIVTIVNLNSGAVVTASKVLVTAYYKESV